jgi:hypothetical protein
VDQAGEWSAIGEWDLELICNVTYQAPVTNTSGTRVIGSESQTSRYHLLARLEQTFGSSWTGSGDVSASWAESWEADNSGFGFIQRGNHKVTGQGNGQARASLRISSLLPQDGPPLAVYFLDASPITIPVAISSYLYDYSGIPADRPSETSSQSTGTREVYVPGVAEWRLPPFEERHLQGSQEVPFGRGMAQMTWSLRPAEGAVVLTGLTVIDGASQENVSGVTSWATTRRRRGYIVVEAKTGPKNDAAEWKEIKWSGVGEPIKGHPNQRRLSREQSAKLTVTANLNETSRSIDVWVLWARLTVLTSGMRPQNAAPFPPDWRDGTDKLGAVTWPHPLVAIEVSPGKFVPAMAASGKVVLIGQLSPPGVEAVVRSGWAIKREIKSRQWYDGVEHKTGKTFTNDWIDDTSGPSLLRLQPDDGARIYDLDAPDIRWGDVSFETYNNFRQWVEWNGERCSDYAPWHYWARWHVREPPEAQVEVNDLGSGPSRALPRGPFYPRSK